MASANLNTINAGAIDYLLRLVDRLNAAEHKAKGKLIAECCAFFGWSTHKVYRYLKTLGYSTPRKTRSDKGKSCVSEDDCRTIASAMLATTRANSKVLGGFEDVADLLRHEGLIKAERTDKGTGEITAVAPQTISRRMKQLGYHPKQLTAPAPHVQMQYKHPNHVWEIDASVCVLFYLGEQQGTVMMDASKYYKNKPQNLAKIEPLRVIRYVVWDGYTGALLVRYYNGAESAANLMDFFIWCTQQRTYHGAPMPVHGVPYILYDDAGSANGAATFKSLLDKLDVVHMTHEPGNPRAKGGVENGQNLVETKFEFKLSLQKPPTLEVLNAHAEVWMHKFNATRPHSRHGSTRYGLWSRHQPQDVRLAPPIEVMQTLPSSKIETRVVEDDLTIGYAPAKLKGARYDVQAVPGVLVNGTVEVCINPWEQHKGMQCVRVRALDTGSEEWTSCRPLEIGENGIRVDAPIFGEAFVSLPGTLADQRRTEVMKEAYAADTLREAKKARYGKADAFGGQIDPFKIDREAKLPAYMQRQSSTELANTLKPAAIVVYLTVPEAVRSIKDRLGDLAPADLYSQIKGAFPSGHVPQTWADRWGIPPADASGTHDMSAGLRRVK